MPIAAIQPAIVFRFSQRSVRALRADSSLRNASLDAPLSLVWGVDDMEENWWVASQ